VTSFPEWNMAATGSDVFGYTWKLLYEVISGNITDPAARNKKFIYANFPDLGRKDNPLGNHPLSKGPIVTIDHITMADDKNQGFGFHDRDCTLTTNITVWSKSGSDGHQHLDELSSNIYNAIKTKRDVLVKSGMRNIIITPYGQDTEIINENTKVHWRGLSLNMDTSL